MKWLFRYLKRTAKLSLVHGQDNASSECVIGYTNDNFVGD